MKWMSCELPIQAGEMFKGYLNDNGIYFETSACYNLLHFECLVDEAMADKANAFIDML